MEKKLEISDNVQLLEYEILNRNISLYNYNKTCILLDFRQYVFRGFM